MNLTNVLEFKAYLPFENMLISKHVHMLIPDWSLERGKANTHKKINKIVKFRFLNMCTQHRHLEAPRAQNSLGIAVTLLQQSSSLALFRLELIPTCNW